MFELLKRMLMSYPVLWNVNFSLPFILQVDASDVGVGAVLMKRAMTILWPISVGSYSQGNRDSL